MKTTYDVKVSDGVKHMLDKGNNSKSLNNHLSKGVRKGLAIMARHHKTKEFIRRKGKPGRGRKTGNKLYFRTGELAKSYRIKHKKGSLQGTYGSALKRSAILEHGGTIRPKKRFLAIPMPGVKGWPREHSDLFFIQSLKGQPLLVKQEGQQIKVMFLLRRKVTIRKRPTLRSTIKKTNVRVTDMIAKHYMEGITG